MNHHPRKIHPNAPSCRADFRLQIRYHCLQYCIPQQPNLTPSGFSHQPRAQSQSQSQSQPQLATPSPSHLPVPVQVHGVQGILIALRAAGHQLITLVGLPDLRVVGGDGVGQHAPKHLGGQARAGPRAACGSRAMSRCGLCLRIFWYCYGGAGVIELPLNVSLATQNCALYGIPSLVDEYPIHCTSEPVWPALVYSGPAQSQ